MLKVKFLTIAVASLKRKREQLQIEAGESWYSWNFHEKICELRQISEHSTMHRTELSKYAWKLEEKKDRIPSLGQ